MRTPIVGLVSILVLSAGSAHAQQAHVFRCMEGGNAFYYKVGPGEFRSWVGAGNGQAARWLDNQCTDDYNDCSWSNGVLSMEGFEDDFWGTFDTSAAVYTWGFFGVPNATRIQCSRAPDPPPA